MMVYKDVGLYADLLKHPGLKLDENHPAVKLKRYIKDTKSYFKLSEQDAIKLFRYYDNRWNIELIDEFGDSLYEFKAVLARSYCEDNDDLTIKELYDAHEVEKELLKESVKGD